MDKILGILSSRKLKSTSSSNTIQQRLHDWSMPKINVSEVYPKGPFDFTRDPSIITLEDTITLKSSNETFQLLSKDPNIRNYDKNKCLHFGLVQVSVKPLHGLGLDSPILLCLCDKSWLNFQKSLLAVVESNLENGPVYFNYYPNYPVSLSDHNVLNLNIQTKNIEFLNNSNPLILNYRVYCKITDSAFYLKVLKESPVGETHFYEANFQCSNVFIPKRISWDQFTSSSSWNLPPDAESEGAESEGISSINNFTYDHTKVRELAAQMVLVHEYPFNMMEHILFNKFMKAASPFYQKISRNYVKQDCMSVYDIEKKKLKALLKKVNRISITTDLWKSGQKIQYMVVTGHFVDSNWLLQKHVLSFKNVPPPHTGVIVADALNKCLLDWELEDKLASITVDNASYNDVCIRRLKGDFLLRKSLPLDGKLFHVRCCAHILNLLVQDGLEEIEGLIDVVRDGIKYLKFSESRINEFAKIVKQLQLPCKKLILDCPTRWNGTYLMLAAALEVKDVFSRYHDIDPSFNYVPGFLDWVKVEEVTQFLTIFYEITNMISVSEYPTANLFLPELYRIKELLNEKFLDTSTHMRAMVSKMAAKFDKYWGECNLLFSFSAVLDPRYKMKLLEFVFPVLYEGDSDKNIDLVRKALYDLYESYATSHSESFSNQGQSTKMGGRMENTSYSRGSHDTLGIGRNVITGKAKFESFVRQSDVIQRLKSDLDVYLEESVYICDSNAHFDAIEWWRVNQLKYPRLCRMACDILAIPITTVASESTFIAGDRVIDSRRSSMKVETVEVLLCASDWVRSIHGLKKDQQVDDDDHAPFEEICLL